MAKTIFEKPGGRYERQGDYLIPCIALPAEEEQPTGTWGQRHPDYLKQYRKVTYTKLNLSLSAFPPFFRFAAINPQEVTRIGIYINAVMVDIVCCINNIHFLSILFSLELLKAFQSVYQFPYIPCYNILCDFVSLIFSLIRVYNVLWEDITQGKR